VLDDLLAVGGVVNEAELVREVAEVEQLLELARRAQVGLDAKNSSKNNFPFCGGAATAE
jgi:hypothetical protein